MKNNLIFIFLFVLPLSVFSQKLTDGKYWVSLKDKTGTKFSLNNPEEFLSARALDRRAKQNISLSVEDLPVSEVYIDSLKSMGLSILGSSRWFNSVIVETYDSLLLDTLDHFSFVSEFHYKIPRKKALQYTERFIESEENIENQFSEQSDYGIAYPQIALLNGTALHEQGYFGKNIRIAVIDGGFYNADTIHAFDSLWSEGRMLAYRDFTYSGPDFFNTSSHGMSVLSTMTANLPGEMLGTAPKASYYLLKSEIVESETPLEEAFWVMAAEFADSAGADIITSSLGYSQFDDPEMSYSYSEMDGKTALVTRAAEKAFSKGMVVVISAGNEGNKPWKYITAPSDGPNILSVGATDTSGNVVYFSSRGPSSDQRVKPDILAVGYKTVLVTAKGIVGTGNGTSFASPQISGMIACLWEAAPNKTNLEIISAVRRSSSLYFHPDDSAGYGIPDFSNALLLLERPVLVVPPSNLLIVPNPNFGLFEILTESSLSGDAKISIYNQLGSKIYSGIKSFSSGYARFTELEKVSEGLCFIVVESYGKKYSSRLLIVRP